MEWIGEINYNQTLIQKKKPKNGGKVYFLDCLILL